MWPPHKVPSITSEVLIFENQELFELSPEDLHQLYMKMHEDVPEAMDYQLRRRAILNGDEWVIRGKQTDSKYRATRIAHTDTQTDIQKKAMDGQLRSRSNSSKETSEKSDNVSEENRHQTTCTDTCQTDTKAFYRHSRQLEQTGKNRLYREAETT